MKKMTAAVLALIILCGLSACGNDGGVSEDTKNDLAEMENAGALDDMALMEKEMAFEQRMSAMEEALRAAYESGDENAIAEAEAAIESMVLEYDQFMEEYNSGNDAVDDGEIYYPVEDDWGEDDGWDDAFTIDEMHDERLFDVDWYHISEDVRTYHIKAYGYGEYDKRVSYSVYDPRTDTTESYGFIIGDGYVDDPDDPTVAIFCTAVYPDYDIHTGGSYAEEIWHMVYVDGDMELQRYTVDEHGYAGNYIDSMLFTTTTPG